MFAYTMKAVDTPFERSEKVPDEVGADQALIKIAGCGVCHTDLSFWHYGVPTRHPVPLVLGHEISGVVEAGPAEWLGKAVIIPAVLPCGECDLCQTGRGNICRRQQMPGNDFDGGFASHITVPARYLIPVSEKVLKQHDLAELAVIADAVSTPYQAIRKSGLKEGDFSIVIGVGGVGIYAAQLARIIGGKVLAIDISQDRLDLLAAAGITTTLNSRNLSVRDIKTRVKETAREMNAPAHGWQIYEVSGTAAGQELAYALLGYAGTLSIIGFTMDKLEVRLSNLMAFDARVIGTWGCRPELYPEVLALVEKGQLALSPFTELRPLADINTVFKETLSHRLLQRTVLVPDHLK